MKFITLDMLTQRVEEPAVLFTRENDALERQLAKIWRALAEYDAGVV